MSRHTTYGIGGPADVFVTPQTEEQLIKLKEICDDNRTENVLYQNEPVTPEVFKEDIEKVILENPNKKIVVAIDNLEIF